MNDYTTPTSILAITGSGKIGNQSPYKNENNEAFQGENFQFSSVLKSTVDSVEKTYSDAQKPKKPADNSLAPKAVSSDQDDFSKDFDDEIAPFKDTTLDDSQNSRSDESYEKVSDKVNANGHANSSSNEKNTAASNDNGQIMSNNQQNAGEVFGENQETVVTKEGSNIGLTNNQKGEGIKQDRIMEANATPVDNIQVQINSETERKGIKINSTAAITENKIKASAQIPSNIEQSKAKGSGEILSSVTLNKKSPEFSDDINKIALKNIKEGVAAQKAPSINNSTMAKQEQDLSNRLKNNPKTPVKVFVDNSAGKIGAQKSQPDATQLNAMPSHTKAPTAQLAELSLEESQASLGKPTVNKVSISGDAKVANHHSIASNSNGTSQSQQTNAMAENQMIRQQAATIGAQQLAANQSTMAPKAPIAIDIPAVSGPAGPNNQPQQVTKVVAPPPPPAKPPAPIEQVAVQIKKAIGEGADKINIKLQPANLGKVEVKMEIGKDGVLTANVVAEKPETLDLLQRDVRGLEKVLQEGGLKTNSQSFNFSLKEQAQQQAANQREETNEKPNNSDQNLNAEVSEDNEAAASEPIIYGQNIATNGGVNIMI